MSCMSQEAFSFRCMHVLFTDSVLSSPGFGPEYDYARNTKMRYWR